MNSSRVSEWQDHRVSTRGQRGLVVRREVAVHSDGLRLSGLDHVVATWKLPGDPEPRRHNRVAALVEQPPVEREKAAVELNRCTAVRRAGRAPPRRAHPNGCRRRPSPDARLLRWSCHPFLVQGSGVARTSRERDRVEPAARTASSVTLWNGACHVASRVAVDTPRQDSACVNQLRSQTTTRERPNVTVVHQTTVDARTSTTIITGTYSVAVVARFSADAELEDDVELLEVRG